MKVYQSINEFRGVTRPIVTTGTFDGVHIGHRAILNRLNTIAERARGESVMLTFNPHPRTVLFPDNNPLRLLNSREEQVEQLEASGLQHLIIQPFDLPFSRLSALEYVRSLIVEGIGTHRLVVGYDHRFGKNREGDFKLLEEYAEMFNFSVEEIPAQMLLDVNVSSTKIRNALQEGDIKKANYLLGYNYPLSGIVIEGDGIGKTLGFPTANLQVTDALKLIPATGVYAVNVLMNNQTLPAMLNIGTRPTVVDNGEKRIEVHLIAHDQDLYRHRLKLEFVQKLRDEQRFNDRDDLMNQLDEDRRAALEILT